ncbi:MAG: ATP-binding protein [Oligoflexia bacterium]|nr:ATP-binding protein [Oligoflexia bacterium]
MISLKSKILFGFISLILFVSAALFYGASTFGELEKKMELTNSYFVPGLKALNQIENAFFLLESDLDKSLHEGIFRPKDSIESVIKSRIESLRSITETMPSKENQLVGGIDNLNKAFLEMSEILNRLALDWPNRQGYVFAINKTRNTFRAALKSSIRNVDHEIRLTSASIQNDINSLGVFLSISMFACLIFSILFVFILTLSLKPLISLAEIMREISKKGLSQSIVKKLALIRDGSDEIGTLSKETKKMATILLDNEKILLEQKRNLENAHTELAQQNLALKNTKSKLLQTEKLGLIGRMSAQMAHEIRNPLNALGLHLEILESEIKNQTPLMDMIVPIKNEVNRLIGVTESYLDLARGPKLSRTKTDINKLLEESYDLYQPLLKEKGISFTCDLAHIPNTLLDKGQIAQVFGNIIKNAVESFSSDLHRERKFIRLVSSFSHDDKMIEVTILDNGVGISREDRESIFNPFYTNKAKGNGLGLVNSRQIVEAHGGVISFDSAAGQGSKFTIRLPFVEISMNKGDLSWKDSVQEY